MLDIVELTKKYFKLSDGRIYEHPFEIDDSISKEEFKKLFKDLSDNIPTDMQDAPFTVEINNSNMVDVHKAIDFILKNKLHLRPLQEGYYYMTSREFDKNNYVSISAYKGSSRALEKKDSRFPSLSVVLPFIYVNDQH